MMEETIPNIISAIWKHKNDYQKISYGRTLFVYTLINHSDSEYESDYNSVSKNSCQPQLSGFIFLIDSDKTHYIQKLNI